MLLAPSREQLILVGVQREHHGAVRANPNLVLELDPVLAPKLTGVKLHADDHVLFELAFELLGSGLVGKGQERRLVVGPDAVQHEWVALLSVGGRVFGEGLQSDRKRPEVGMAFVYRKPSTKYGVASSLGASRALLQNDLRSRSTIASPHLQKSLQRRRRVVLVVVIRVGKDGPILFEKPIYEIRPPQ